jgi:hypothetical protein
MIEKIKRYFFYLFNFSFNIFFRMYNYVNQIVIGGLKFKVFRTYLSELSSKLKRKKKETEKLKTNEEIDPKEECQE